MRANADTDLRHQQVPTDSSNDKSPGRLRLWILRFVTFVLPVVVIVGAIAANSAMSALSPETEEKEEPPRALPVLTTLAIQEPVTLTVRAQGEVEPRTEINLVSEVNGRISYMSPDFIEGGRFNRGDLLMRINATEYELRVVQARANVAAAETVLAREQSESELAKRDWEDLGRSEAPSALTLREPQMAEAAAQLESAKARLAEAELQLTRTAIRAPFDGRVGTRNVDLGEYVSSATQLGDIYASDIVDVKLPLTQDDLRQTGLYLGYSADWDEAVPVTLSADIAGDRVEWEGRITRTDSRFDSTTRVLHAYVEVRDPFAGGESRAPIAPGLFVDAEIAGEQLEGVVTIPRAALRGNDTVYVANADNTLSIRTVRVQSSDRERAVLSGDISAGDSVVTSPIRGAAEGMTIETVDRASTEGEGT